MEDKGFLNLAVNGKLQGLPLRLNTAPQRLGGRARVGQASGERTRRPAR